MSAFLKTCRCSLPILIAAALLNFTSIAAQAQSEGTTLSPIGAPVGWVTDYTQEIDEQVARFSSAYSLDESAAQALRSQLLGKLADQWRFESDALNSINKAIEDAAAKGVEPDAAVIKQFEDVGKIGPLNDLVIAQQLESGMDPQVATQGRTRLEELLTRRDLRRDVVDSDLEQQAAHNASLAESRVVGEAPISAAGNPLPRGEKLASVAPEAFGKMGGEAVPSLPVQPNTAAIPMLTDNAAISATGAVASKPDINEVKKAADALLADPTKTLADVKGAANGRTAKAAAAAQPTHNDRVAAAPPPAINAVPVDAGRIPDKGAAPSRPMPAAVEAVRLQSAPPLDDWDKYVDTTCKKFGFTDAQVIKAQSILKDLRTRAAAYRSGRNDDFAAAERLTDAKAKADRKKELSAPIDAFFEELKQRLDNLATLEQRAKATAPVSGKK